MKTMFLVGPHASGKTYLANKFVSDNKENTIIDTGPIMRRIHQEQRPDLTIDKWVEQMENLYGKDFTSSTISNEISNVISSGSVENYIIIGFRSLEGIFYTINKLNIEDYQIVYIDAPYNLLYQNFLSREKKDISFESFKEYIDLEQRKSLGKVKSFVKNASNIGVKYIYRSSNNEDISTKIFSYLKKVKTRKKEIKKEGERK